MNIESLFKQTFKRFANLKNGTIVKKSGKDKWKKLRRRQNSKVSSPEFIFDTENEEEEESAITEVVEIKPEPVEKETMSGRKDVKKLTTIPKKIFCYTCKISCLTPSGFATHLQTKKHRKKCIELGAPVQTSADYPHRPWTLDDDKLIVQSVLHNEISQR